MQIEKTYRGWILDDQGWRTLFDRHELARLGISPDWDPWSEHPRLRVVIADLLYYYVVRGRGERIREEWRFRKK